MKYILNIGLETSIRMGGDGSFLYLAEVVSTLKRHGVKIKAIKKANSRTEPTAIVSVLAPTDTDWEAIATELYQEAIAIYNCETLQGELIGKFAHLWGEFNPAYFLL